MKNNAILCKLWGCWWKLHLCFDQLTKYNPDVVFDKNDFLSFLLKMLVFMQFTYIQVLIKKKNNEARVKQINTTKYSGG